MYNTYYVIYIEFKITKIETNTKVQIIIINTIINTHSTNTKET